MNYENFVGAVEGLALKYQRKNPGMYVSVNRTDCGLELTCMTKEQMRKRWIDQMLTEYSEEEYENWSEVILCDKSRKIMVVGFADPFGDNGYGVAKCSPTDVFDEDTGMAVAFAHFRGYPIPNFI
jgi:hypothetical protein